MPDREKKSYFVEATIKLGNSAKKDCSDFRSFDDWKHG